METTEVPPQILVTVIRCHPARTEFPRLAQPDAFRRDVHGPPTQPRIFGGRGTAAARHGARLRLAGAVSMRFLDMVHVSDG